MSNPAAPLQTPVATSSQDEFRLCEVPRRPLRGEGLGEGLLGGSLSPRPDTTGLARPLAPGTLLSKPCSLLRASSIVVSGHAAAASCFAGAGEAAAEGGASTEPPDLGLRGKELVRCLGLCPKLCRGLCPKLCTKLCRGLGSARSAGFHLGAPPRSRAAKSRAFTHLRARNCLECSRIYLGSRCSPTAPRPPLKALGSGRRRPTQESRRRPAHGKSHRKVTTGAPKTRNADDKSPGD